MRHLAANLFLLTCLPSIVLADPATECGGSSQVEIGSCVAETLERVDATVDIYLGFAMSSAAELDEVTGRPVAVPALEAAQAAWSAYRDAHCGFVGSTFGGGSGTGIGINSCRIELGRNRAEELMRHMQ
ncbi:MAG: lysozyme inhibitor LprI family protein [Roseovarius sp.]